MKYFFLFLIACVLLCCKKEDSNTTPSFIDYISQAPWKLDVAGLVVDKNGTIDIKQPLQDCQLDDTFVFAKDGTGTYNNGATKCSDTEPQTTSFTWSLQNNILSGNIPGILNGSATVNSLTTTTMELWKDTTVSLIPTRIIVKLKH